jgi:hypothetical protein
VAADLHGNQLLAQRLVELRELLAQLGVLVRAVKLLRRHMRR